MTRPVRILPVSPANRPSRLSVPDGIIYNATVHTAIPIITEHITFLQTDSVMPDSFNGPSFVFNARIRSPKLSIEARDKANASPACPIGPIKITPSNILAIMDITAV